MAVERNAELRAVALTCALAGALACALLATGLASAQSTPHAVPETSAMIDALKPAANRGMRNLVVREAAPEPAAPVAAGAAGAVMAPPALPPSAPAATTSATTAATTSPTASPTPTPNPAGPAGPAGPADAAPSLSLAIQFDLNSARVRPESGAVLGNLVAALLSPDLKSNRFVIEGHTDARGVPSANLRLSQQRADEVRLYLVALGVHPARLKAVGKGSSNPANPLDPLAADNRRVRVVTLE